MRTKIWTKHELIGLILLVEQTPEELHDYSRHFYASMKEHNFTSLMEKRMAGKLIQQGNRRYYFI